MALPFWVLVGDLGFLDAQRGVGDEGHRGETDRAGPANPEVRLRPRTRLLAALGTLLVAAGGVGGCGGDHGSAGDARQASVAAAAAQCKTLTSMGAMTECA